MKTRFIEGISSVFSHRRVFRTPLAMELHDKVERDVAGCADVYTASVRFATQYSVSNIMSDSISVKQKVPLVIQKQLAHEVYGEVRAELKRLFPIIHELQVYSPECAREVQQVVNRVLEMTDPR